MLSGVFFLKSLSGVVLSLVCDVAPLKNPFLLVLDGRTLQELGRAEVEGMPFGIHGLFVNQLL